MPVRFSVFSARPATLSVVAALAFAGCDAAAPNDDAELGLLPASELTPDAALEAPSIHEDPAAIDLPDAAEGSSATGAWAVEDAARPSPEAPATPILMFAMPAVDGPDVELYWIRSDDDSTAPAALAYEIYVSEQPGFDPLQQGLLVTTLEGAEHARLGPFEREKLLYFAVVAVDTDGQRSGYDEPIPVTIPTTDIVLADGVAFRDMSGVEPTTVEKGYVEIEATQLGEPLVVGEILTFSMAQVVDNFLSMQEVVSFELVGGSWKISTRPVFPEELIVAGNVRPTLRFFDVPEYIAPWQPDPEAGWQRREILLGEGIVHTTERRLMPAPAPAAVQQKTLCTDWWDCVESAAGSFLNNPFDDECFTYDLGDATFAGGATRFAYACYLEAAATSCDWDDDDTYTTFSALGQSDNGKACLAGSIAAAFQGQFGLGGQATIDWGTTRYVEDIGSGPACDRTAATTTTTDDCQTSDDRSRGDAANADNDITKVFLNPRILGGFDARLRAQGEAGVTVEYQFYDVYRVFRPAWFFWFTLGSKASASGEAKAAAQGDAGMFVPFRNNVGLDVDMIYDGRRAGGPVTPKLHSSEYPWQEGPNFTWYLRPHVQPRASGAVSLEANAEIGVYVYLRVLSTVYAQIGPAARFESKFEASAGTTPDTCGQTARIDNVEAKFMFGPAMLVQIQNPITGNTLFGLEWAWPVGDPFWADWTLEYPLVGMPSMAISRWTGPRGLPANVDLCPGQTASVCFDAQDGAATTTRLLGFDWDSDIWHVSSGLRARSPLTNACLSIQANTSGTAGTIASVGVEGRADELPNAVVMCEERPVRIGTFAQGCRWQGDGFCDFPTEACGTADCPWGSRPECTCGDSICDVEIENCGLCPADCGVCAPPITLPSPATSLISVAPQPFRLGAITGVRTGELTRVTRPYYTMQTEVSQLEYFDVMNAANGSPYPSLAACRAACNPTLTTCPRECPSGHDAVGAPGVCLNCPVENVNFVEAAEFANALSAADGIPQCYTITYFSPPSTDVYVRPRVQDGRPNGCVGWRIPTQAEWEYAYRFDPAASPTGNRTRAGDYNDTSLYSLSWDGTGIAWCGDWLISGTANTFRTHPSASFPASPSGLYDMSGNVSEWIWDEMLDIADIQAATDPGSRGINDSSVRHGARGGSFVSAPIICTAGHNYDFNDPLDRNRDTGFRLVRTAW